MALELGKWEEKNLEYRQKFPQHSLRLPGQKDQVKALSSKKPESNKDFMLQHRELPASKNFDAEIAIFWGSFKKTPHSQGNIFF